MNFSCPICLDVYVEPQVSSCGHTICGLCVQEGNLKTCPICRKNRIKFVQNYEFKKILEAEKGETPEYKKRLYELKLLSDLESNIERLKREYNVAKIEYNKYDEKTSIRLLRGIYEHLTSNQSNGKFKESLKLNSNNTITMILNKNSKYNISQSVVKYYMIMTIGETRFIIMSNNKDIFS